MYSPKCLTSRRLKTLWRCLICAPPILFLHVGSAVLMMYRKLFRSHECQPQSLVERSSCPTDSATLGSFQTPRSQIPYSFTCVLALPVFVDYRLVSDFSTDLPHFAHRHSQFALSPQSSILKSLTCMLNSLTLLRSSRSVFRSMATSHLKSYRRTFYSLCTGAVP